MCYYVETFHCFSLPMCPPNRSLPDFLAEGPQEAVFVFYLAAFLLVCALVSCFFNKQREGFGGSEFWGPTRLFAKVKSWLQNDKGPSVRAYFLTELLSAVCHAPVGYLVGYKWHCSFDTPALQSGRWMAAIAFCLWVGIGMGRSLLLQNQQKRDKKIGTNDEAVKHFLDAPLRCIVDGGGKSPWGIDGCRDIFVRSKGVSIAFVENVAINKEQRVATIGHIAVAEGFERRKIGRRLALALRSELAWHYGVDRIEFAERSDTYEASCYPEFFRSLGAVQQETFQTRPGRGNWVWAG